MNEYGFDVKLECLKEKDITIRFYSSESVELRVIRPKAFYGEGFADEPRDSGLRAIFLVNDYKLAVFHCFPKSATEYKTLTFEVKNRTYRKQWAVDIKLDTGRVGFKPMIYEEF